MESERIEAFLALSRRCRYRFPRDDVLRHFPIPFVVRLAKEILASERRDAELIYFVARVLNKAGCTDPVLAGLYLAMFSLQGDILNGQEWAVFDAYAEECFDYGLDIAISTGTDDEKLDRMKTLVQARRINEEKDDFPLEEI